MTPAIKARRLLRRARFGALATLSGRLSGHPFATVVPYVPDHLGRPLFLISSLAEHTKNLQLDPRASLMVHDHADDILAAARVTCVGRVERLESPAPHCVQRYLRYVPKASELIRFGDFAFYRLEPGALHWVGGFGEIDWIPGNVYLAPPSTLDVAEAGIIEHMNCDRGETLVDFVRFFRHREGFEATMIGVDCDGFDVRADGSLLRFDFSAPATTTEAVRAALDDLARRARRSG